MRAQRIIFLLPCLIGRIECLRYSSESAVAAQKTQLLARRRNAAFLKMFHHTDCCKITGKDRPLAARRGHICRIVDGRQIDQS